MFPIDDGTANILLMARMVFPEAVMISMESGPHVAILWRAKGYATNTVINVEVQDMTAAMKVGIHPLTYFTQLRKYALAQLSDFESWGDKNVFG